MSDTLPFWIPQCMCHLRNAVNTLSLDVFGLFDEAGKVLKATSRCEGPRYGK